MIEKPKKKRILVLVADYPNNDGGVALMYVHTRNMAYKDAGHDVTVLNFSASGAYDYDGICVITLKNYEQEPREYDILLLHAANLRNHYRFLRKYENRFPRMIFFYHGHEVLKINEAYSKPYDYLKRNKAKEIFQDCYDVFKLGIWREYIPKIISKSEFVFVSHWMEEQFYKYTRISRKVLENRSHITYNSVGRIFESETFEENCNKEYDFITIRSFMDGSKYCIDLVNQWAYNTPNAKFLIVGKGEIFKHYEKASNVIWLNQTMKHKEMLQYLNASRFALMPTRTDAQGLMMCEMAAYGIPVITSDISVCHEVFDGFENVFFVSNDKSVSLDDFLRIKSMCRKDDRFFLKNTVQKELEIIDKEK